MRQQRSSDCSPAVSSAFANTSSGENKPLRTPPSATTQAPVKVAMSMTAAKFLQRFVDGFPWAHLDIAGSAWKSGAAKGSTGRPVGLLVSYLVGRVGKATVGTPTAAPRKAVRKARSGA